MSQQLRHRILQKLFWNPVGVRILNKLVRYETMFDTVVRGYSLMGETNGERWVTTLMEDEPIVFDVGSHDGASTKEILAVRPKATVYSFDPSRFGRESYEADLGDDPRVRFSNIALSDAPGEMEFFDYENRCNSLAARKEMPGEEPTVYRVEVSTLDRFCRGAEVDHIDFLKIDAEGYDLNVLEGAGELLAAQSIDMLMFEFASGWAASKRYLWEAVEYFEPLPYTLYHLYNGFLAPLVYDIAIDSCCTRPAMYVAISDRYAGQVDVPIRDYQF